MSDYKTMRVPEEAWEAAKAYKEEHELTWDEYLRLPVEGSSTNANKQEILDEIHAELDRLHEQVSTNSVEDRDFDDWFEPDYARTIAEHIRQELEQQSGSDNADELRELKGRLDDLESQLPRKVAQELGQ